MWPKNDPNFSAVMGWLFNANPFRLIGSVGSSGSVMSQQALLAGFQLVFQSGLAKQSSNGVLIWAVYKPYQTNGKEPYSTIVNIDKTDGSIAQRWPPRNLRNLADDNCRSKNKQTIWPSPIGLTLRQLADADFNLSFYQQLISNYGPLSVYWASVDDLNQASKGVPHQTARDWECQLCSAYVTYHWCLPLKNREC